MATERQIAANRRNAKKSRGPKSASGKKRSSQNAFRHGLSSAISTIDFEKQIELLARQIAGDAESILELAKIAAEGHLQVQQVMQLEKAMIERIMAHGDFDGPKYFRSKKEERQWFKANFDWIKGRGPMPPWPVAIDPLETMPKEEPYRTAEAIRRLLPELVRLQRYQNRAAGRRDRAIRKMTLG
jgi:hypothetical protein